MKQFINLFVLVILVSGCASTGILKISQDTYMISKERWGFSTVGIKADVFKQANAFAASQGKIMIPLIFKESPVAFGHYPTVELQFRIADKNDPLAKQTYEEQLIQVQNQIPPGFNGMMNGLANIAAQPSNSGMTSPVQPIQRQRLDGHEFIYNNSGQETGYINHNERERLDGRKNIYDKSGQSQGYIK